MIVLEIRTSIPQTEDAAADLAAFAMPWNQHFDMVAFCYRNQERLFDPETRSFYD